MDDNILLNPHTQMFHFSPVFLFLLWALVAPATLAREVEFFISPTGCDSNSGTMVQPFQTMERAREAVKKQRLSDVMDSTFVTFLPGRYHRTTSFVLTAEDSGSSGSPVVWRALKAGTVFIEGGVTIGPGRPILPHGFGGASEAAGICSVSFSQVGIGLLPLKERGFPTGVMSADMLFSNGRQLVLCRYPNQGFASGEAVLDSGDAAASRPSLFSCSDSHISSLSPAEGGWLFGYFRYGWADRLIPLHGISKGTLSCGPYSYKQHGMALPPPNIMGGKIRFQILNLATELDAPGEYFYDYKAGVLYYIPVDGSLAPLDVAQLDVPMVSMNGVHDLRFEGLFFALGRSGCFLLEDCSSVALSQCSISRFAAYGIEILRGKGCCVDYCTIDHIGRTGISVDGGDRSTLVPGSNSVTNCHIHHFGTIDHTYVPGIFVSGVGNTISHNWIHHGPSSAMRLEGNDHRVTFNEIEHVVLESIDQGAVDMYGNPSYQGNYFGYNRFSDVGDLSDIGSAGRSAIRLDDAISGTLIECNIFIRCSQGFGAIQINCGRGNLIRKNFFSGCSNVLTGGYNPSNSYWTAYRQGTSREMFRTPLYMDRYPGMREYDDNSGRNYFEGNILCSSGPVSGTNFVQAGNSQQLFFPKLHSPWDTIGILKPGSPP